MDLLSFLTLTILIIVGALVVVTAANVLFWPKVTPAASGESGVVSILIPARDEESNLEECLARALGQGETVLEVLVYDDHSRDRTPEILADFARRDSRVRAVAARPLEADWCGKNFACAQLAAAARGEFLLFIDADARLEDGAAARMISEMRGRRLTMLSCWPGLEMLGFWERALMPMLNFVVFTIFPAPLSLLFRHHSLAVAHGACLIFTRDSYERIGGHRSVRSEIFEDVRLAQLWRRRGERALCLDGQQTVDVRMYASFDEIRRGFEKNFFPAFRHEFSFWIFILFRLIVFLAPFFWLAWRPGREAAIAVGGVVSMRLMLALYFRHPVWSVLLHPIAEVIVISIGLSSWRRCRSGRGVSWKGREYRKRETRKRRKKGAKFTEIDYFFREFRFFRVLLRSLFLPAMPKQRAVIIGGGLGGLGVALRLAARGWRVTVCESGASLGGKMNAWQERGFRFDTGPSLITMPWIFEDLFEAAGSRLADHLELVPMHPISQYVYPDGTRFDYSSSLPDWLTTLKQFDSREADGFLRFMELGARLFAVSSETFLRRRPRDFWRAGDLGGLRHMPLRWGWGNYHRAVEAHFRSPHLRQLYDRYPTYVGSSPYRSPATLAVIPYIEYAFGGWYPRGGLYRIVESLTELARGLKVELRTGARVTRIERDGDRVRGVRLGDGERIEAEVVVMNGDAGDAPGLLGEPGATGLRPADRSMSGLVFLFGVRRSMSELRHHTIYFSEDYRREFDELFVERRFPSDPTVYVNAPSRTDRTVVPGEGEALFVMANAPANDDDEWDESRIVEARRRVMNRLRCGGFPDIEDDLVVSDVWTPQRIGARYQMPGGAIYGTHSHGWRKAFLRPPNKDRGYRGLYYVGGSTHPGGGTPTVLISAQITGELIERYERP